MVAQTSIKVSESLISVLIKMHHAIKSWHHKSQIKIALSKIAQKQCHHETDMPFQSFILGKSYKLTFWNNCFEIIIYCLLLLLLCTEIYFDMRFNHIFLCGSKFNLALKFQVCVFHSYYILFFEMCWKTTFVVFE